MVICEDLKLLGRTKEYQIVFRRNPEILLDRELQTAEKKN